MWLRNRFALIRKINNNKKKRERKGEKKKKEQRKENKNLSKITKLISYELACCIIN